MSSSEQVIAPGANIVVTWEPNQRSPRPNAVKSNRTANGRTKKIILPADDASGVEPRPGEVWVCRVEKVTGASATRGAIFVRPITRKIEYHFEDVYVDPVKAQLIATVLQDPRRNLMMQGVQGVGKSTIAHAIAKTLGWEYRKVSGGLIKKFTFMLGRVMPDLQSDSLKFTWADSKLVEALKEANQHPRKTFLIMIDEYTRIDEDARDALLDVIEGNARSMRLPSGEEVLVPKNVVFMAAGNVGEGFTIRQEDAAAVSRWVIVEITFMPPEEELQHCLKLYPNCPKEQMDKAISVINAIREAKKDPRMRLSKVPCTRGAEGCALLLASGFSIDQALETTVANPYAGTIEDGSTERGRVHELIKNQLSAE